MLAFFENYLAALRTAHSAAAITEVLGDIARHFGFRSAYLIEYKGKLLNVDQVLDTDPDRRDWWRAYFSESSRPGLADFRVQAAEDRLMWFDATRFGADDALRKSSEAVDLLDVAVVPISHDGDLVGLAGFSGTPELIAPQEAALQLIAYTVFAQSRSLRHDLTPRHAVSLTPREREVIRLSAEGLTSLQIGQALGMSTRTANQHVDNVASKLGTKNRAHTVAEVIRHGLLD